MSKGGNARPHPSKKGRGAGSRRSAAAPKRAPAPRQKRPAAPAVDPTPAPVEPGTFALGAIPGATPGRWIDVWKDRMPHVELSLVPLTVADQRAALVAGDVDAAIVRLPIEREGLHLIPLYDEVPVVVSASDSHLTAADELELSDLAGEVVITPLDDVLGIQVKGAVAPRFEPPADTAEAIATVATGVGIVIVPMSLARLHHRKDTEYRPLRNGPSSSVAFAWVTDDASPHVETFVGIVRGRTANSSRG
jgi:DNA-binding transcriptional LysR family regulator